LFEFARAKPGDADPYYTLRDRISKLVDICREHGIDPTPETCDKCLAAGECPILRAKIREVIRIHAVETTYRG